jgi:very-short-patch-repair endonuclease
VLQVIELDGFDQGHDMEKDLFLSPFWEMSCFWLVRVWDDRLHDSIAVLMRKS